MDMGPEDARKDAIVVSPHKFPGGPGASGVLIVNRARCNSASVPVGPVVGQSVLFHLGGMTTARILTTREEAGTPNVIGDIRAALAFIVKDVVGTDEIAHREAQL